MRNLPFCRLRGIPHGRCFAVSVKSNMPSFARETWIHDREQPKGRTRIVAPLAPLDPLRQIVRLPRWRPAIKQLETATDIQNTGVVGVVGVYGKLTHAARRLFGFRTRPARAMRNGRFRPSGSEAPCLTTRKSGVAGKMLPGMFHAQGAACKDPYHLCCPGASCSPSAKCNEIGKV